NGPLPDRSFGRRPAPILCYPGCLPFSRRPRAMNRSPIAFALVLTSTCSGCYSTWDIAPSEMKKLDGYRAPMGKVVHDKAGADVPVDASTELAFRATTGEHIEAKFDSLTVPP